MDFKIDKEQKEYIKEVIKFAKENLNEEKDLDAFSMEQWRKVSEFGILGITLPEEYGGMEESYMTAAMVVEALGYGCINNGLTFVINNHIWVAQNIIYHYGSTLLREKYLNRMTSGELIGAFALTEAESGSDAFSLSTTAIEEEDCYVLNGSKVFVSNGAIADVFIVIAQTQCGKDKKFTAFVVEKGFEGFSTGPEMEKMGLDSCPICEIIMDNCRVPKENVLGVVGRGSSIVTSILEWERIFEFVPHIGAMHRILDRCCEHVNTRKQFNKYIKEYQQISSKIAEMKMRIELAETYMYKIADFKDRKKSAFMEASVFKLFVSESYVETCKDAMQIFGAYGYSKEYGLEREMRDALACTVYSGTNEMQRNTIFNMIK
jgi:alkylation response protein AidB-like acyl-CoA dehydrogenase